MTRNGWLALPGTVCLAVGAVVCAANAQEAPEALRRMQAARQQIRTALVEYVDHSNKYSRATVYTSRVAQNSEAQKNRGDPATGAYWAGSLTGPSFQTMSPHHEILKTQDGDTWMADSDVFTNRMEAGAPHEWSISRMRALGVWSVQAYRELEDTLRLDPSGQPFLYQRFEERTAGRMHMVRGHLDRAVITWYIDESRGWNPVRVTCENNGRITSECRATLRQYDGVWFPETVAFFNGPADEAEHVVKITRAEFNRPEHPRVLTPADLGLEAGVSIMTERKDGTYDSEMFDGQKAISREEYERRSAAGDWEQGPKVKSALAKMKRRTTELPPDPPPGAQPIDAVPTPPMIISRQMMPVPEAVWPSAPAPPAENAALTGTPAPAAAVGPTTAPSYGAGRLGVATSLPTAATVRESEWEAYTRRFIERYGLAEAQSQRAWSILRDCQAAADRVLTARRDELTRLENEIEKARQDATAATTAELREKHDARLTEATEKRAKLLQPVFDIFDQQLKPRLDKLPTRAQRKAAGDAAPQTQPSATN